MGFAALLYIGQTPRPDVTEELVSALPEGTEIREYGMLDGLTPSELESLTPLPGEARLVTRLADGRTMAVAEARLFPLAARCVRLAERDDPSVCILMCTGAFPPLPHRVPLRAAHDLLHGDPALLARREELGVILPHPAQLEQAEAWWGGGLLPGCTAFASPYEDGQALESAARKLRQAGAKLLVLDCMGYTLAQGRLAAKAAGLLVTLPRQKVIDALRLMSGAIIQEG